MDQRSDPSPSTPDAQRPLERFKPTNGLLTGYAGLALAVFAIGYVAINERTLIGLQVGLGALFFGVVIWLTQLRPRAAAYPNMLRLKNSLRDADIPYLAIDEIAMGQTLSVWVGERRYVCIGIGNSIRADLRQRARNQRQGSLLSTSRPGSELSEKASYASLDQTATSYPTFVVARIEELIEKAQKEARHRGDAEEVSKVQRRYAVPELALLVVTGIAFVVSLLF